jgi:hypothetical protein
MEQSKNSPLDLKTTIAKAMNYCISGDRSQQELHDKVYDLAHGGMR